MDWNYYGDRGRLPCQSRYPVFYYGRHHILWASGCDLGTQFIFEGHFWKHSPGIFICLCGWKPFDSSRKFSLDRRLRHSYTPDLEAKSYPSCNSCCCITILTSSSTKYNYSQSDKSSLYISKSACRWDTRGW